MSDDLSKFGRDMTTNEQEKTERQKRYNKNLLRFNTDYLQGYSDGRADCEVSVCKQERTKADYKRLIRTLSLVRIKEANSKVSKDLGEVIKLLERENGKEFNND